MKAREVERIAAWRRHFPEREGCAAPESWQHQLGSLRYRHANIASTDPANGNPMRMCANDRGAWPCQTVKVIDLAASFLDSRRADLRAAVEALRITGSDYATRYGHGYNDALDAVLALLSAQPVPPEPMARGDNEGWDDTTIWPVPPEYGAAAIPGMNRVYKADPR